MSATTTPTCYFRYSRRQSDLGAILWFCQMHQTTHTMPFYANGDPDFKVVCDTCKATITDRPLKAGDQPAFEITSPIGEREYGNVSGWPEEVRVWAKKELDKEYDEAFRQLYRMFLDSSDRLDQRHNEALINLGFDPENKDVR